jgi:hypothetical protein
VRTVCELRRPAKPMVGAKEYFADLRAPLARATTLRRGLVTTECSYVKPPCPSAHTSYSRYSSNANFLTRMCWLQT